MTLLSPSRTEVRTTLAERFVEAPPSAFIRALRTCGRWLVTVLRWTGLLVMWLLLLGLTLGFWLGLPALAIWGLVCLVRTVAEWIGSGF